MASASPSFIKKIDEIKTNGILILMSEHTPRTKVEEEHYHLSFYILSTMNCLVMSILIKKIL